MNSVLALETKLQQPCPAPYSIVVVVVIGRPPEGGKLGIPALKAWNLAARPMQSTSYFPRRGQVLTPQLPGIEPSAGFQSLDSKSGSSAGLSRFELGLPPGGLGPHRPLRLDH